MVKLGKTARHVREVHGLTQKAAAALLGVSEVYLSRIENNHAVPSADVIARYRELWDVDLYVLAWCPHGDVASPLRSVQAATKQLADVWQKELESKGLLRREKTRAVCSS